MTSQDTLLCQELLKKSGYRLTPLRVALLLYLKKTKKPVTAGDILKGMAQQMDKVTLYRALEDFVTSKLITRIKLQGNAFYYEFVHHDHHHHHIVCTSCGSIEDVEVEEKVILREAIKQSKQFKAISSHSLEFFGVCQKCC